MPDDPGVRVDALADGGDAPPDEGAEPARRPSRRDLHRGRRRRGSRAGQPPAAPEPGRRSRRRSSGRRAAASRSRRRARVRRLAVVLLVVLLGIGLGLALAAFVVPEVLDRVRDLVTSPPDAEDAPPAGPAMSSATLVTVEDRDGGRVASVAVLAYDREADRGTVVLVPTGTVAEVPGHGTFTVGEAYTFGQAPLLWVTVDNLLGVAVDEVATVDRDGWERIGGAAGGVEVDVAPGLVGEDGRGLDLAPGPQRLEGTALADYVLLRGEGERELERLPRLRQVLHGLLASVAEDPSRLDDLVAAPDAPVETEDPELLRGLLAELADAHARDRVSTIALPVSPLGSGPEDVYRVDGEGVERLVEDRLGAARPERVGEGGTRLQILNGVGVPGIGQEVAERLRTGGYRIVLTGNADHFDHDTTLIIVYDDRSEQVAVAREIRELLGVGDIELSTTPQTVVDVTIVVGEDFRGP